MIYLDTSVVIPYFVEEPQTPAVETALSKLTRQTCISHWTEAEFASALAKKVRNRECTPSAMERAVTKMAMMATDVFTRWLPSAQDYQVAVKFMLNPRTGLRAGDALHLAIAQRHDATVWTLDKGMFEAARVLKIPAKSL